MLGYRLVRDRDWDDLRAERAALLARIDTLQAHVLELVASEARASADASSAKTKADLLIVDLNHARQQAAIFEHRVTGLPAMAPQIVSGQPRRSEALGAGVDLFEDVGEEAAKELARDGLLHDAANADLDLETQGLTSAVKG